MSKGTNLGSRLTTGTDLWIYLTEPTPIESGGSSYALVAACNGVPPTTASVFKHGCLMFRMDTATGSPAIYQNTGSSAVPAWTLLDTALPGDTASSLIDTNSVTALDVGTTASAVNNLRVTNSATGAVGANQVKLSAVGTDAAVSVAIEPKGATGITTIGLSTGTGDIIVGSSSGAQSVKLGNGAGVATVNLANTTVAGAVVNIASAVTGAGITDTLTIAGGNAAATGVKIVNIATGTPGTDGNNRVTVGGGATSRVSVKALTTQTRVSNYIATETGANNAIAGALLDASGAAVAEAEGLEVVVALAHTLQAGANTFALNGGAAGAIKKHTDGTTDIGTAYASTGVVKLLKKGAVWMDMSQ